MASVTSRFVPVVLLLAAGAGGCASPMHQTECQPECQSGCQPECQSGCQANGTSACQTQQGPSRWSEEWYDQRADGPVGTRQVKKCGKYWPPYPRPVGEELPWFHRFHAEHYWPYPYVCADRDYVRAISERQVENGWIDGTTLYYFHFDEETSDLTHSGEIHLQWILENAPINRRVVWVQAATDQNISQVRLANTRQAAVAMVGEENVPPIMLRVASPQGRPALEVEKIRELEIKTMPDPRVIYQPQATGAASGP